MPPKPGRSRHLRRQPPTEFTVPGGQGSTAHPLARSEIGRAVDWGDLARTPTLKC